MVVSHPTLLTFSLTVAIPNHLNSASATLYRWRRGSESHGDATYLLVKYGHLRGFQEKFNLTPSKLYPPELFSAADDFADSESTVSI
jgi:hypothetical protein